MEEARALFRNRDTTEFVIVTIPTAMAVAESGRLAKVCGCASSLVSNWRQLLAALHAAVVGATQDAALHDTAPE